MSAIKKKSLPKRARGLSYTFTNIPDDVYSFLLAEQMKIKLTGEKKQFGIPSVAYKLLRQHPNFKNEK